MQLLPGGGVSNPNLFFGQHDEHPGIRKTLTETMPNPGL